jgi:hypothetical protein
MKLTGKYRSTRVKTCPSAILSTTNSTWNPDLQGRRPVTNRLSHGTAKTSQLMLAWEIIAVCSEIHPKRIEAVFGGLNLVVPKVTTRLLVLPVVWDMKPCHFVISNRGFGEACFLRRQGCLRRVFLDLVRN